MSDKKSAFSLPERGDPSRPQIHEGLVEPGAWADYFVQRLAIRGFGLDFGLADLGKDVDRVLSSALFYDYNQIVATANRSQLGRLDEDHGDYLRACAQYLCFLEYETGLSAYIGEVLRRAHDLSWSGTFAAQGPMHNQHSSVLTIRGKDYNPSRYPASRLNGAHFERGSLTQQLQTLLAADSQNAARL